MRTFVFSIENLNTFCCKALMADALSIILQFVIIDLHKNSLITNKCICVPMALPVKTVIALI